MTRSAGSVAPLLVLIAVAACHDAPTAPSRQRAPAERVALGVSGAAIPGRYIVVLRGSVSDVPRETGRLAALHAANVDAVYEHAIKGFAARLSDADAQALARDPSVALVEPDRVVRVSATQSPAPSWGLDRIDQQNLPLSNSYTYAVTGAGVHVYIIDTGIQTSHPDFGGRASGAYTAVSDGNGTNDCNGHGTHVAGTVGGNTYGVAKGVTLHAVRVLDCGGSGTSSGVIAGINWVTANAIKPAVANMSLGGGIDPALDQALTNSVNAGITYAVAAGNSSADACYESPARAAAAITVGSTTSSDAQSWFSNYGSCVDIYAPGSSIVSDWIGSSTNTISGTSMASPHVTGAAALYLQTTPAATPAQVTSALTSNATVGKVTGIGPGSPNRLLYVGFIGGGGGGGGGTDTPPRAAWSYSCTGLTCTLDASASTDDHGVTSYVWNFGDGTGATRTTPTYTKTYAAAGTYSVRLTVKDALGQMNALTQLITVSGGGAVDTPPVASFTVSCTDLACSFDGTGSTDDHGITAYSWAFGDGTTGTGATASHSYAAANTYTVTLTVRDGANQTNSASKSVTVTAPSGGVDQKPVASFTVTCSGLTCTVDASASTDDKGIASYVWNFGDGTGATRTVPTFTKSYAAPGTYNIRLNVKDTAGQLSSAVYKSVTVQ